MKQQQLIIERILKHDFSAMQGQSVTFNSNHWPGLLFHKWPFPRASNQIAVWPPGTRGSHLLSQLRAKERKCYKNKPAHHLLPSRKPWLRCIHHNQQNCICPTGEEKQLLSKVKLAPAHSWWGCCIPSPQTHLHTQAPGPGTVLLCKRDSIIRRSQVKEICYFVKGKDVHHWIEAPPCTVNQMAF